MISKSGIETLSIKGCWNFNLDSSSEEIDFTFSNLISHLASTASFSPSANMSLP